MKIDVCLVVWTRDREALEGEVTVDSPRRVGGMVRDLSRQEGDVAAEMQMNVGVASTMSIFWVEGMSGYTVHVYMGKDGSAKLMNLELIGTPRGASSHCYEFGEDEEAIIPEQEICSPELAAEAAEYFATAGRLKPGLPWYDNKLNRII